MVRDQRLPLIDMLQAIEGIREVTTGIDFASYRLRRPVRRAVEREIEIISEASRRLASDLKARESGIPWQDIAGIGNILRHDYQNISDQLVWNVVANHLPPLEAALRRLLAGLSNET